MNGDKMRFGVVGGGFGEVHIQGYKHYPVIEVNAICRRRKDLAEQLAHKYHIEQVYTDYDEMLKSANIDAVSLAVPNHLHYPMALSALSRGKHVVCEKPLAMSLEEAEHMVKEAEKRRLINMTVFNWRYVPALVRMKELVREGDIGSPYHISFCWLTRSRRDRKSLYGWRYSEKEAGFGAMGDTGVHGIDLIHWIAGDFRRVISDMSIHVVEHKTESGKYKNTEVEDSCSFLGELVNGAKVIFHVSSVYPCDSLLRLKIYGSAGVLIGQLGVESGDFNGKLFGGKAGSSIVELTIPKRLLLKPTRESDSPRILFFVRFAKELIKAIHGGENPLPNFRDGLKTQRVLQALASSRKQNKWVKVET